jgi:hypothetical protein
MPIADLTIIPRADLARAGVNVVVAVPGPLCISAGRCQRPPAGITDLATRQGCNYATVSMAARAFSHALSVSALAA